jgi:hypothetical protein
MFDNNNIKDERASGFVIRERRIHDAYGRSKATLSNSKYFTDIDDYCDALEIKLPPLVVCGEAGPFLQFLSLIYPTATLLYSYLSRIRKVHAFGILGEAP